MRLLKIFGYITWALLILLMINIIIIFLTTIVGGLATTIFAIFNPAFISIPAALISVGILSHIGIVPITGFVLGIHVLLTDYIIHKKLSAPSMKYFKYAFNYHGSVKNIK